MPVCFHLSALSLLLAEKAKGQKDGKSTLGNGAVALSVLAAMGSLRQMVAAGQQIANSARGTVFASSRNVPRTRKDDLVP